MDATTCKRCLGSGTLLAEDLPGVKCPECAACEACGGKSNVRSVESVDAWKRPCYRFLCQGCRCNEARRRAA